MYISLYFIIVCQVVKRTKDAVEKKKFTWNHFAWLTLSCPYFNGCTHINMLHLLYPAWCCIRSAVFCLLFSLPKMSNLGFAQSSACNFILCVIVCCNILSYFCTNSSDQPTFYKACISSSCGWWVLFLVFFVNFSTLSAVSWLPVLNRTGKSGHV
jgi:hypothetical protein